MIQRETDLLTPDELRQHKDLADAAILEELTVWPEHRCFDRQKKQDAYNVMDSRFVAKWKIIIEHGKRKRIIRMRMALRFQGPRSRSCGQSFSDDFKIEPTLDQQ